MSVTYEIITENNHEQRLDNFLMLKLKGVPKSHIYRLIRSGQVRVNKKRAKPMQKLFIGDSIRIPPVRVDENKKKPLHPLKLSLEDKVLFECDAYLVLNKPSGMAVHGGSGVSVGVIEQLRLLRADAPYLELVHRLDKETSGCLVIAKKRSFLRQLHEQLRLKTVKKTYYALLNTPWAGKRACTVDAPLKKNVTQSGERMVFVDFEEGKASQTGFKLVQNYEDCCLVAASPLTGRTHQIRVHAKHLGQPILGDSKYGLKAANARFKTLGLKRLFLHAKSIQFSVSDTVCLYEAPLPDDLLQITEKLPKT